MASLFAHGALAALDPISGAVAGPIWRADGCAVASASVDAEVTQHPREQVSGAGGLQPSAEARLERGETIQVEFKLADGGSEGHPVPAREGRAAELAAKLVALARDPRLLVAWIADINANAPVRDIAMGQVTITKDPVWREVRVSANLTKVVFANVTEAPLVVDADLIAAGLV